MTGLLMVAVLAVQEPSTFRVTAPLVMVPTVVKDSLGKTIEGLTEADFVLLEDGVPQRHSLDFSLSPISLVLVIEANFRSGPVLRKVQRIGSLLQPVVLGERGSAAILTFADETRVWQEFTSKPEILGNSLKTLEPQGRGVMLNDALSTAVQMLARRKDNVKRRAVIVISEEKDHGSKTNLAQLITEAQANNVIFYPVSYSAYATAFTSKGGETFASGRPVYNADPMSLKEMLGEIGAASKESTHSALAQFTGGMKVNFATLAGLEKVVARIGEDLHSQYLLSFAPALTGGGEVKFRKLEVRVKGHPEAIVRTRPGYWLATQ